MEFVCERELCTGCSLCSDVCAHEAITMCEDRNGFIAPVVDGDKCADCGLCQKCCPVLNPDRVASNKLSNLEVYEAWATKDEVRKRSSSGGVFGQLAHDLLLAGGVVVGASFDGKKAYHKDVADVAELRSIQDTKYVQSCAHGSYKKTLRYLKEGKNVIFSGTPCQVAACKSYIYKKHYEGRLLTVELVCHGVPSYLALKKSMEYVGADTVVSFRDKKEGWGYHSQHMTYKTKEGKLIYKKREEDLFYRMFFCKKLLRESCYSCPFAHMPRIADITIGDSWGTSNKNKADVFKGLSLLLVNNENGKRWLGENKHVMLRSTSWLDSIYINRNVYTPFPPPYLIDKIPDVYSWITRLDAKEYMKNTTLGYIEQVKTNNAISEKIRRANVKFRRRLLDMTESKDLNAFKFLLLIASYKLDSIVNPKASERYLDGKFTDFLRILFKSKK